MNIRRAVPEDAEAISALIVGLAQHFLLEPSGKGAERFFTGVTPQAIRTYISHPRFHYLVADQGAALLAAAALRDGCHLFHLFVAPSHQRQGIARSLWSAIRAAAAPDAMSLTVNASPNAVAVYQRFGFVVVGPRQEVDGIAFIPMQAPASAQAF
jgi:GNAT superfamily N-acetyltransferase